jgi:hypothetical protein
MELGSIDDVSLDCGHGVHAVGVRTSTRREMHVFSKPIEGVFRWDRETEQPEVVLTWTDVGEPCQERILLTASAQRRILPGLVRGRRRRGPAR